MPKRKMTAKRAAQIVRWQTAGALKRRKPHGKLKIVNNQWENGGVISATTRGGRTKVGHLMYNKYIESNDQPAILLNGLFVEQKFQRRGIGTAILRKAKRDFPNTLVNPGPRSNDGEKLYQAISRHKEWAGLVIRTPQDIRSNLRGEYKLPRKAWKKAR